ncbi:Strictosidine synthase 1 [Platanthera guangdongensis]|uniref:Strictosidine synthase 1 n=1 Tax=Platanthera guangdongensis TaxID=2320717 RepID=A0ABR2LVU4_9ASPA
MGFLPQTLLLTILLFAGATTSAHSANGNLQRFMLTDTTSGPESVAFDPSGEGPYVGVADGLILKRQLDGRGWQRFAFPSQWSEVPCHSDEMHSESECGRPLGLRFNEKTGELYIADAYFGLMVVQPEGGWARTVAAEADGVPFVFTNGVDVDQETGLVYFTDSSLRFNRWDHDLVVITGDATGRLMKYDPATKEVSVLLSGLKFPNGVAVSRDRAFVLVASTTECLVWRYWLQGSRSGQLETFAQLPGYPDNIKRNADGDFWVAINMDRLRLGDLTGRTNKVAAVKLSRTGATLETLDGAVMSPLSEVAERNGTLWLGSVELPYLGFLYY